MTTRGSISHSLNLFVITIHILSLGEFAVNCLNAMSMCFNEIVFHDRIDDSLLLNMSSQCLN